MLFQNVNDESQFLIKVMKKIRATIHVLRYIETRLPRRFAKNRLLFFPPDEYEVPYFCRVATRIYTRMKLYQLNRVATFFASRVLYSIIIEINRKVGITALGWRSCC